MLRVPAKSFLFAILCLLTLASAHGMDGCLAVFDTEVSEASPVASAPTSLVADLQQLSQALVMAQRPQTPQELATSLRETGRRALKAMNTQTKTMRIENASVELVLAKDTTPLNRLALQIRQAYGADLLFWPEGLVELQAHAFASALSDDIRGPRPILVIGPDALIANLQNKNLLKDVLILHELRHIRTIMDLIAKLPSAFYGSVTALKGQIPDDQNASFPFYTTYLQFDEIKTYHAQLKQLLIDLRALLKAGNEGPEFTDISAQVKTAISAGLVVSHRAELIAKTLQEPSNSAKVRFKRGDHGSTIAWVKLTLPNETLLQVELPLIASQSPQDPRNFELFPAQLALLRSHSHVAHQQFAQAWRRLDQKQELFTFAIVATLDEIQAILNPALLKP